MSKVLMVLNQIKPNCDFSGSKDFFLEGLLDSIDLLNIVDKLQTEYKVTLQLDDLSPENFKNLKSIEHLFAKYSNDVEDC